MTATPPGDQAARPVSPSEEPDPGRPAPSGPQPIILGVAAALSRRFGVSVAVVRAIFTTLAVAGGAGVGLYLLISLFWRRRPEDGVAPSGRRDLGAVLLTVGLVWELRIVWPGVEPMLVLPVGLVALGVALGWRNSSLGVADLTPGAASAGSSSPGANKARQLALRMVGGVILCIGGLAVFLGQSVDVATLRDSILGLLVALAGVSLVLGPSAVRFFRAASVERDDRVRAEERARVAAHLHDSVLQTLTLIQKKADDPTATAALARHQERSLRRWLYGTGPAYGTGDPGSDATGWRTMFETMVGSVEDDYATAIELVMVGEGEIGGSANGLTTEGDPRGRLDDRMEPVAAILAAAREGLINASKFSGETHLSIYCELGSDRFDVFVRDRGRGFDLATIDPDRRGVRDSIIARMASVGGTADIRTSPGQGTEVALSLPVTTRPTGNGSHPTGSPIVEPAPVRSGAVRSATAASQTGGAAG